MNKKTMRTLSIRSTQSLVLLLTLLPLSSCQSIIEESRLDLPVPMVGLFLAEDQGEDDTPVVDEEKNQSSKKTFRLDEISVTATRSERRGFNTPKAINVADSDEINRENQLSIVDSLDDKIGMWVEKRTLSTSDPVMRGFAGANILALIDGCTLTTLWGEGGEGSDDMYGKVDSESIERIEVIRGPSSVLYGSNALGGVINFFTKSSPYDYTEEGFVMGGRVKGTYASAAQYYMLRQEIFGATPDLRFFLGGTSHKYDSTEGGRGVGVQSPTGGRDYNWDMKLQYRLAENQELELAVQDVRQHKTRRYYRPTQQNFSDREAVTLTWRGRELSSLLHSLEVKTYYQDKLDKRKDFANLRTGESHTETYSADIQAVSLVGDDHRLTYGMHYHEDHGENPGDEEYTWKSWTTGVKSKDAPDSTWNDVGVYVQDEWDISQELTAIGSVRYDVFRFESDVDRFYTPAAAGFNPMNDDYSDTYAIGAGGLGLVYRLNKEVNLVGNLSRGYRIFPPVFGFTQHGEGVHSPAEFLDPVVSHTAEVGTKVQSEKFAASCFTYYSSIRKWQSYVAGAYNGMTHYDWDNDGIDAKDRIYVKKSGRANLYGVEIETETRLDLFHDTLPQDWVFAAGFAWNYGTDFANDEPLRHTHPARALLALRWIDPDEDRNGWFEFSADAVRKFTRIPSDRWAGDVGYLNDPQNPASGMIRSEPHLPGYTVFDVRGGLDLCRDLSITMAVENLTDKKYRRAHSRWDEPGINFVTSLTYRF